MRRRPKQSQGLPISCYLALSTAHMPNENPDFGNCRRAETEYGYVVWDIGAPLVSEEIPTWLRPILQLARRLNISLIEFDADNEAFGELEVFPW